MCLKNSDDATKMKEFLEGIGYNWDGEDWIDLGDHYIIRFK